MSNTNRQGLPIPPVIEPGADWCVKVYIPADIGYLSALMKHLEQMAHWWAWERDEDKRGKDCAAAWLPRWWATRSAWDNGENCEDCDVGIEDVRLVDCVLEKLVDGVWTYAGEVDCLPPPYEPPPPGSPPTFPEYPGPDLTDYDPGVNACAVAANRLAVFLTAALANDADNFEATGDLAALAVLVAGGFFSITGGLLLLAPVVAASIGAHISYTTAQDIRDSYADEDNQARVREIFYCACQDGQIPDGAISQIRAQLQAETGAIFEWFDTYVEALDARGLNNIIYVGWFIDDDDPITAYCEWQAYIDFTQFQGPSHAYPPGQNTPNTWSSGDGWLSACWHPTHKYISGCAIQVEFDECNVSRIEAFYEGSVGTHDSGYPVPGQDQRLYAWVSGSPSQIAAQALYGSQSLVYNGAIVTNKLEFASLAGWTANGCEGYTDFKAIRIYGNGPVPDQLVDFLEY